MQDLYFLVYLSFDGCVAFVPRGYVIGTEFGGWVCRERRQLESVTYWVLWSCAIFRVWELREVQILHSMWCDKIWCYLKRLEGIDSSEGWLPWVFYLAKRCLALNRLLVPQESRRKLRVQGATFVLCRVFRLELSGFRVKCGFEIWVFALSRLLKEHAALLVPFLKLAGLFWLRARLLGCRLACIRCRLAWSCSCTRRLASSWSPSDSSCFRVISSGYVSVHELGHSFRVQSRPLLPSLLQFLGLPLPE